MRMGIRFMAGLLAALIWTAGGRTQDMPQQMLPAASADSFVDTIGMCTHWDFRDTPYGRNYEQARQLLKELGVRYIRDSFGERNVEIYNTLGIKTVAVMTPPLEPALKLMRQHPQALAGIEGPNETNGRPVSYKGIASFPQSTRLFQDDLYAAVKGDPALKDIPVIAPSIAWLNNSAKLAPLLSYDYAVMHSYSGGGVPSQVEEYILDTHKMAGLNNPLKRIVATETGYHTAFGLPEEGHQGVPPEVRAKYLPRLLAEYFNRGVARTFLYEFLCSFETANRRGLRSEAKYGLVNYDLTPSPAYNAVQNLIAILKEPGAAFSPRALPVELACPEPVGRTLLQKANGDYYLLLWRDVKLYENNPKAAGYGKEIPVQPVPVTLTLPAVAAAAVINPRLGAEPQAQLPAGRQLQLTLGDELLMIHLRFAGTQWPLPAATNAAAPQPPQQLGADAETYRIRLHWKKEEGRGYFVRRLGAYLGFTRDGAWNDDSLLPAAGYAYEVTAVDAEGNESASAKVQAMTDAHMPDLVLASLHMTPADPAPGQPVVFRAVLRNTGKHPTPQVTHGVVFRVDGKTVSWSDTFREPLAPGQSREVSASNGPDGRAEWTMTGGPHILTALADDRDRIRETNEENNAQTLGFPLSQLPDYIVTGVTLEPAVPDPAKPLTLTAVVKNQGQGAFADTKFGVCFRVDGAMLCYDLQKTSLAPGESKSFSAILAPEDKPKWELLLKAGTLTAYADDVNRIPESVETNNSYGLDLKRLQGPAGESR